MVLVSLELELRIFPKIHCCWKRRVIHGTGRSELVPVLRRNDEGDSLIRHMPYHQWSNIYWQAPPNGNGSFNFKVQAFSVETTANP